AGPGGRARAGRVMTVPAASAASGLGWGDRPPAASGKPLPNRGATRGAFRMAPAIGAIADDAVGARHRHVREGEAIDADAERVKIGGDQAGPQVRGGDAPLRVAIVEPAVGGPRREFGPLGRP